MLHPNDLGSRSGQGAGNVPFTTMKNETGQNNGVTPANMPDQNLNQVISNYGTLIFSGNNFKIYKIS